MARQIHYKTWEELQIMMACGKILKRAADELVPMVKEGLTTNEVDKKATELIKKLGGEISFDKVPGYKWATCLPVNEQIVHTPPSDYVLKSGDILTVDIGALLKGFHTDYATTIVVGKAKDESVNEFLSIGERALEKAINIAATAKYIGEISQSIEHDIYGKGYFILHELTGHGIGRDLHEAPYVPGVLDRPIVKTPRIQDGLVIAVEVIYSTGTEHIRHENGEAWSIVTSDGSLSACFEKTIAFFNKKMFILT